jgi:2,3-diketo-5-methylthiopentyl-1-phosphate enolase
MTKRLYDPTIFVQSLDSIDRDKYIIATYYIEDSPGSDFIDHFQQIQRMVLEGSTGSWMRVAEETDEVREALSGKLLGYYEVPAPPGTKKAVVQIAFPTAAWELNPNFAMMILSFAGNCFIMPTDIRLLDVAFPPAVAKHFQGPKFGVSGVREYLGVYDRPLLLHIIKPKMGMTPEETARQVYQTAIGGADIMKDDEMAADVFNCSMEARLEAVMNALKKAEEETGRKYMYMLSITDEANRVQSRARWAFEHGANGLLVTYSAGYGAIRAIAEDPDIKAPVLLHVSHMVALLPRISFTVLAKLGRLAGADMMLTPSIWAAYQVASLEESLRTTYTLQAPFYGIKPTLPLPGGGIHPGLVPQLVAECGVDVVVLAGGGLLGHPMGATAGASAFRQAIDATIKDVPLEEAAKEHEELRVALEFFGTVERPKTEWGYMGHDFRPKVRQQV